MSPRGRSIGWIAGVRADAFETELRRHGAAVELWSGCIAKAFGLAPARRGRLMLAARLHDIGKLLLPRSILNKPGPLTDEEWMLVKRHPEEGARLLADAAFDDVRPLVLFHHERHDGRGYPFGLQGQDIPMEARIIAVADAWCAMTSDRPYQSKLAEDAALEEIAAGAGRQFDPEGAAALVDLVVSSRRPAPRALPPRPRAAGRVRPVA